MKSKKQIELESKNYCKGFKDLSLEEINKLFHLIEDYRRSFVK